MSLAQIVIENCKKQDKERQRQYLSAYGYIPEKYHGYILAYPTNIVVFNKSLSETELAEVRKSYPTVYMTEDKGKTKVFYATDKAYFSADGHFIMARDEHIEANKKYDLRFELITLGDKIIIKAIIDSEIYGHKESLVDINFKNAKPFDLAQTSAARKVFSAVGYGRYPSFHTDFGEDPLIKEFREFKMKKEKSVQEDKKL